MPVRSVFSFLLTLVIYSTNSQQNRQVGGLPPQNNTLFEHVGDIPLPPPYRRVQKPADCFATWLRAISLKRDKTVYLYDGTKKTNQSAQFAVLDVPVGDRDLQQCADAVMRLRAEFLLSAGRTSEICFTDNAGGKYHCPPSPDRRQFQAYLERVYSFCGTSSLSKQLKSLKNPDSIQPGDVLIKGGSPGHAVIVMDVAENKDGKKLFLLAQSYMPAQSVHILINPIDPMLSPWYQLESSHGSISTPEWIFKTNQFKTW